MIRIELSWLVGVFLVLSVCKFGVVEVAKSVMLGFYYCLFLGCKVFFLIKSLIL